MKSPRLFIPAIIGLLLSSGAFLSEAWASEKSSPPDQAKVKQLGQSAAKGDLAEMQRLLASGVDINAMGKNGYTALHRAILKDQLEAARWLIAQGASLETASDVGCGMPPISLAKSAEMANLLKESGAKIDASSLRIVVRGSDPKIVQWFLDQGLDAKMEFGSENLLFYLRDEKIAALLLDQGAEVNLVDQFGSTPLSTARSGKVAQVFIDRGAKLDGLPEPLLPRMASSASPEALEVALKAGMPRDEAILQKGLIVAAHGDRSDVAEVLLKHGAKPNSPGVWHGSMELLPLKVCTIFGCPKTARVLLKAGADPNGGEGPGDLIRNAMQNGHVEVVKILHEAGAQGVSEIAVAVALKDEERLDQLLPSAPTYEENPRYWDYALSVAARNGNLKALRGALEKGVRAGSGFKEDPYYAAAAEGQHEALTFLLESRPPDDPKKLRLALWGAASNSHPYKHQRSAEHFERCIEILIKAGAPVNGEAKDSGDLEDAAPIVAAVYTRFPGGNPKVIEMLIRAGANPNPSYRMPDDAETTLLDAVALSCKQEHQVDSMFKIRDLLQQHAKMRPKQATQTK